MTFACSCCAISIGCALTTRSGSFTTTTLPKKQLLLHVRCFYLIFYSLSRRGEKIMSHSGATMLLGWGGKPLVINKVPPAMSRRCHPYATTLRIWPQIEPVGHWLIVTTLSFLSSIDSLRRGANKISSVLTWRRINRVPTTKLHLFFAWLL